MAKILYLATLATLAIVATLFGQTTATSYIVGGESKWSYPANNPTFYATWASEIKFKVGDALVFNFATGQHSVARVTKKSYDICNVASYIELIIDGPASITLNSEGEAYFFCSYGQHCAVGGQKLAINVTASTSGAPSPPPPSLKPTPSPLQGYPPPSSGGHVLPTSPPSNRATTRTGFAKIITVFISSLFYFVL